MSYSVVDFLRGAQAISRSVFGRKSEYQLQFNHEEDGCWYIDFPNWPFEHHNLMMVAGADRLCAHLSKDDKFAYVSVIPSDKELELDGYGVLIQTDSTLTGGANYITRNIEGFDHTIWLCPVTLFVLGQYPKYIYVKGINDK